MSDKLYSNVYPPLNNIYNRAPCAKQPPIDPTQQYYYNMPINNSYNQLDAFNMLSPQTYSKNQNVCMYPEPLTWDSADKMEMIEITSKDLSPASFCSNLDVLMPDFYKMTNKFDQYGGYNQKVDFPSCAQSSQNGQDKTVKYCSIQSDYNYVDQSYNCKYLPQNQDFYLEPLQNQYFELPTDGFQQIEIESNDESDIVVEESEDETNESREKAPSESSCCVICNIAYRPLGTQFYFLGQKSPLTMSSQKPVLTKIRKFARKTLKPVSYLCSECLGLINTIDHLQFKLINFRAELVSKFKKTCQENGALFIRKPKRTKIPQRKNQVKCKLCKKVLSLDLMCRRHLKRHKSGGFLCELCGAVFSTKRKFKLHYNKHKPPVPKIDSFKCTNCPKCFRTKSNLAEHENFCLGLLPYHCKFCDKKFASTTKLKNHVKLKHDKKFIAICSICNIGFVTVSDYKSHKISHSTDKKFTCFKCDKSYKTLSNLNFHLKVHSGKLPFNCNICDKGFMRKEYLEAHVNNHNGIKNFSCSVCNKKFVSQKNLDAHLKYHDGSAKTNTCNICGKVMATGFEEHLRIHNNLREFECDQCDLRFNTKGTLSKHKKKKHQ